MKRIDRELSVEHADKDTVRCKTMEVQEFTSQEASQLLTTNESNLSKLKAQRDAFEQEIKNKFWEAELDKLNDQVSHTEELIEIFRKGTEAYYQDLSTKGRSFIKKEKIKHNYSRTTKDARIATRSRMMADTTSHLGLQDVNHPVMLGLRKEFEEIK